MQVAAVSILAGNAYDYGLAVRPVVSLKSDITVEDLEFSSSGTVNEWTTEADTSGMGGLISEGQVVE